MRLFKSAKVSVLKSARHFFEISGQKLYVNDGYNENRAMVEDCDILFAFAVFG